MALMNFFSANILPAQSDLLFDNFSVKSVSRFRTVWEGYTDRVMGGISDMSSEIVSDESGFYLRMVGKVRTENNGGFIQMRLGLEKNKCSTGSLTRGCGLSYAELLGPMRFIYEPLRIGSSGISVELS